MSDFNNDIKQLIDSFSAYRNVLAPLQESLHSLAETYGAIREDLDNLSKSLSGNAGSQLEKIHATLNQQAKSGQELSRRIDEYAESGEKYSRAVTEMTRRFGEIADKLSAIDQIEKTAEAIMGRLEELMEEKRASYNVKELQRSLDTYNKNVEKISEFINKDIASVLQQNAEKIESIRRENEALTQVVGEQGKSVAELTAMFAETSVLLRQAVENGSVNEEYIFDAFDKWAVDRKVKIKRK